MEKMPSFSPEAELIRQIEDLIGKLAAGTASNTDIEKLHDLQKRRVEMMRPRVLSATTAPGVLSARDRIPA